MVFNIQEFLELRANRNLSCGPLSVNLASVGQSRCVTWRIADVSHIFPWGKQSLSGADEALVWVQIMAGTLHRIQYNSLPSLSFANRDESIS